MTEGKFNLIVEVGPKLITDPAELRLTVDPDPAQVEIYGKRLSKMKVVYARQPFPTEVSATIFLAGPTPRDREKVKSWRPEALRLLEDAGFSGHVFVPEDPDGSFCDWEKGFPYDEQVAWEEGALHRADVILFWIPRTKDTMPGFTTNDEFGFWKNSGKVVLGTPVDAVHVRYQRHFANKNGIPVYDTLKDTVDGALSRVGGAERVGGECQVPMILWGNPAFQSWYSSLKQAGNHLTGARMLWNFNVDPLVSTWGLLVDIHVAAEGRNETKLIQG